MRMGMRNWVEERGGGEGCTSDGLPSSLGYQLCSWPSSPAPWSMASWTWERVTLAMAW